VKNPSKKAKLKRIWKRWQGVPWELPEDSVKELRQFIEKYKIGFTKVGIAHHSKSKFGITKYHKFDHVKDPETGNPLESPDTQEAFGTAIEDAVGEFVKRRQSQDSAPLPKKRKKQLRKTLKRGRAFLEALSETIRHPHPQLYLVGVQNPKRRQRLPGILAIRASLADFLGRLEVVAKEKNQTGRIPSMRPYLILTMRIGAILSAQGVKLNGHIEGPWVECLGIALKAAEKETINPETFKVYVVETLKLLKKE
jgi:hypothetical protein